MSLGTVRNIDTFFDNSSKTEFYKPQLKLVADKIVVDKIVVEYEFNTKKAELCQAILDYFVEEDLIPEEQPPTNNSELKIRQLKLEHRAHEQQRDQEFQLN